MAAVREGQEAWANAVRAWSDSVQQMWDAHRPRPARRPPPSRSSIMCSGSPSSCWPPSGTSPSGWCKPPLRRPRQPNPRGSRLPRRQPPRSTQRLRACSSWPHHDPGGWGSGRRAAAPGLMSATAGSALGRPWFASMEVAGAGSPSTRRCLQRTRYPRQGTVAARAGPVKVFGAAAQPASSRLR
jgi:hypothetical protein